MKISFWFSPSSGLSIWVLGPLLKVKYVLASVDRANAHSH